MLHPEMCVTLQNLRPSSIAEWSTALQLTALSPLQWTILINKSPKQFLYLTSLMYSSSKMGIPQPGTYTSSQLGDPEATDNKTKVYIYRHLITIWLQLNVHVN